MKKNNILIGLACIFLVISQNGERIYSKKLSSGMKCLRIAKKIPHFKGREVRCETVYHKEEFEWISYEKIKLLENKK